ncbi:MAG: ABC transporter ATP-binding protein [Clostridia bacterium]|nr:ABC transporter ATP-binding protein [Clostridia bacterium]
MLEVSNLNVYYGGIHAVKDVSLTVEDGQIVTLVGANGAGKSSTLRAVAGIVKSKTGTIRFMGHDITRTPTHQIIKSGLTMSPEGRKIFPNLTVGENLALGSYGRNDREGIAKDLERVFRLFPRLKERQTQRGGTLSGGEQQMLAVGRALMSHPKLLMLDEPSLGLAPVLTDEIFQVIATLHAEGTTILLIEQNAFGALNIADVGYVLENGKIALSGPGKQLLENELIQTAYLGKRKAANATC